MQRLHMDMDMYMHMHMYMHVPVVGAVQRLPRDDVSDGDVEDEEDGEHPIELANCFETLGEINTEHSNFKEALEDLERCLAILEMELEEDDRRIAGVLCSMSVAHQMLDEYDKALKGCTRAIGVCASRVKRLKSSDENAVAAVAASWPANAPPPEDPLAVAKAELEQIEAVLGDLTAREEELKGLADRRDNEASEIATLQGERSEVASGVEESLLGRYDRLLKNKGDAAAIKITDFGLSKIFFAEDAEQEVSRNHSPEARFSVRCVSNALVRACS